MGHCWKHGDYDGWSCRTCDLIDASHDAARESADATTESADAARDAAREMADATREAAERFAEEEERTREAIEQASEEHRRIARDGWKLEVESKIARAVKLLEAGLIEEAETLAGEGVRQDPGNWYAHTILGAILRRKGRAAEASDRCFKAVTLLPVNATSIYVFVSWLGQAAEMDARVRERTHGLILKLVESGTSEPEWKRLIMEIGRRGWTDDALALSRFLNPNDVDDLFVHELASLSPECAEFLAGRLLESDWPRGVSWALELSRRRRQPFEDHALLGKWGPPDGRAMVHLLADRRPRPEHVAPAVLASIRARAKLFHEQDKSAREAQIEEQAQQLGRAAQLTGGKAVRGCAGLGCLMGCAGIFMLPVIAVLAGLADSNAVGRLVTLGGVLFALIGGPMGLFTYNKVRTARAVRAKREALLRDSEALASRAGIT